MWLPDVPDADAELRQGDLIVGIPFPKVGTIRVTPEGMTAETDANATAVVLDQCCTIEQRHVVLLGRVTSREPDERMMRSLTNLDPSLGKTYSAYMHLLDPHDAMPAKKNKRKVINLLDRLQFTAVDRDQFQWLREKRKARMDVASRAHLRLRLAVHFGRVEDIDDRPALKALGLDDFGRPEAKTTVLRFPGS